jgi:hypothetical protein
MDSAFRHPAGIICHPKKPLWNQVEILFRLAVKCGDAPLGKIHPATIFCRLAAG